MWKGDWNPGAGKIYKDKLCGWEACGCGKGGCLMCTRYNLGGGVRWEVVGWKLGLLIDREGEAGWEGERPVASNQPRRRNR